MYVMYFYHRFVVVPMFSCSFLFLFLFFNKFFNDNNV